MTLPGELDAVDARVEADSVPSPGRARRKATTRRPFPGDRRVWLWSLVALVPMLGAIGYYLVKPRDYYTGTNSVGFRSPIATLPHNRQLCVPGLSLPGGTAAVQFSYADPGPVPPITVTVVVDGRTVATGTNRSVAASSVGVRGTVPISPALPERPQAQLGSLCVRTGHGAPLVLGGFSQVPLNERAPTIDGHPIAGSIDLWFLPKAGEQRSLIESWPTIMHRLALFRPGFAGAGFFWLLLMVGLPLLAYSGLRVLAVAREPGQRLVLSLAVIGFASAAMWAITTVAFDAPDESEHFAYTESLAEAGRAPDSAPTARPSYATDESFALEAIHHFSSLSVGDTRPPWFPQDQQAWRVRVAQQHPPRDNGGGFAEATHLHSPLYYSLLVPGYGLGRSGGIFTELFWMRLISALLATVTVLATFWTLRELVPSRPELAVAAALLVAFEPMFSFMSGAVNNDNGVNAMAALAVYQTVRALRRGLTWRTGLALGATAAVLPLMKATGLALLPAIGVALACIAIRPRNRATLLGVATAVASFAAVLLVWGPVASLFHRAGAGGTTGAGASTATNLATSGQLGGKLSYLWEVFLPRLPFMAEHFAGGMWPFMTIYVKRGFAAFGWYAFFFPQWVYRVIVVVMVLAGVLALAMAVQRRRTILRHWREALFLILVICGVIAGVEFAYYSTIARAAAIQPEQGRYAFTAIVALAALAVAGLIRLPRRAATAVTAVAVAAMICFAIASHLLYLADNFT